MKIQMEKLKLYTKVKTAAENGSDPELHTIPRVKRFLFCLPLKFGCVISALLVTIYSIIYLTENTVLIRELAPHVGIYNFNIVSYFALTLAVVIVHTVTLYFTALMFCGVSKGEPSLIRPWITWTTFQMFVYTWMLIYSGFLVEFRGVELPPVPIICAILNLFIRFYLWVIVASYYKELEE